MSASVPDASEIYISAGPTQSRPRSPSPSTKSSTPEEDAREFNKRLLVSLGMLLPALAAIIGKSTFGLEESLVDVNSPMENFLAQTGGKAICQSE